MGKGNKEATKSADAATQAFEEEEAAARGLAGTLSSILSQSRSRSKQGAALEIINLGHERSKLRSLRTEMRDLRLDRLNKQRTAEAGAIRGRLTAARTEMADPNTTIARTHQLHMEINGLLSRRLQLDMELRAQSDGMDDDTRRIKENNEQIVALLQQEGLAIVSSAEAHRDIAASRQRAARAKLVPQPNLAAVATAHRGIAIQVKQNTAEQIKINQQMKLSVRDTERLHQLEQDLNVSKARGKELREEQLHLQSTGLGLVEDAATVEDRITASLTQQRGVSKPKLLAEAKVTREKKEHRALLMESVALGKRSVREAEKLARTYDKIANKNLKKVNAGIDRVQKGTGRMNFAMQQFGFMIEDGASQMGTRGLAGAVGAMSNNLTAMVGVLAKNPLTLIGVSIGVAITQIMIQTGALEAAFEALGFGTEDLKKKNEELSKSYDLLAKSATQHLEQTKALQEIQNADNSESLKRNLDNVRFNLKKEGILLRAEQKKQQLIDDPKRVLEIDRERARLNSEWAKDIDRRVAAGENVRIGDSRPALHKKLNVLMQERAEIQMRLRAEGNKMTALQIEIKAKQEKTNLLKEQEAELMKAAPGIAAAELAVHEKKVALVREDIAQEKVKQQGLQGMVTLGDELVINSRRRKALEAELALIVNAKKGDEEQQLANVKRELSVRKEISTTLAKENQLKAQGDAAAGKAEGILSRAKERAGESETEDERRLREHGKFVESLEKALDVQSITLKQQKEALATLEKVHAQEKKGEELDKRKTALKEKIKATSKAPAVGTAVEAGSAEAGAILNQAILDGFNEKAQEPLVAQMAANEEAIKGVEHAIKGIPVLNLKKKS